MIARGGRSVAGEHLEEPGMFAANVDIAMKSKGSGAGPIGSPHYSMSAFMYMLLVRGGFSDRVDQWGGENCL